MIATATAACRVDLAGGTLDIWPLGLLHPGSRTVNVAIDVRTRVWLRRSDRWQVEQGSETTVAGTLDELRRVAGAALLATLAEALDWPPFQARLQSDSPRGAGLGASSALTVALLAASQRLLGRPASEPPRLARLARDLEARLMGLPTGLQDHYPALLGGALDIQHQPGGEVVSPVAVDLDELSRHLGVFYSGQSHFSAGNNWAVIRSRLSGEPAVVAALDGVRDAAAHAARSLRESDWAGVGAAMGEDWTERRRLAPEVSTPLLERALAAAHELGAWGGKACGAGGGGCIAVLAPAGHRAAIRERLFELGLRAVPAAATGDGLEVAVAAAWPPGGEAPELL